MGASIRARGAGRWPARIHRGGELLFSHAAPAAVFGTYAAVKGWQVFGAAAALIAATGVGLSPSVLLVLVVQMLGLLYFGLLALVFVIRLPRLSGRRSLWTVAVALFATLAVLTI